jgi:hypothetical protein
LALAFSIFWEKVTVIFPSYFQGIVIIANIPLSKGIYEKVKMSIFLFFLLLIMAKGFGKLVLTPKQKREAKILNKSVLQNFQN